MSFQGWTEWKQD